MRFSRKDTVVIGCRWCLYGDGLPIFSCLCFHSFLGSAFTKFYHNQRIRSQAFFHWREFSSGVILYEIFSFLVRFVVQDSVTPCLPYVLYKSYGFGLYYFKFTNGGIVRRVPEHICICKLRADQRWMSTVESTKGIPLFLSFHSFVMMRLCNPLLLYWYPTISFVASFKALLSALF